MQNVETQTDTTQVEEIACNTEQKEEFQMKQIDQGQGTKCEQGRVPLKDACIVFQSMIETIIGNKDKREMLEMIIRAANKYLGIAFNEEDINTIQSGNIAAEMSLQ